ncbi:MAG: hypothetical protein CR957_00105 [Gammaproteobacteria bacterium]|nr:MAG: hypothetical protein CR957_00105 [Gammaproteobacteria bacterium]
MSEQNSFQFLQSQAAKEKAGRVTEGMDEGAAFLAVSVHNNAYHIPVSQIREIIPSPKVTAIGHTKPWLSGLLKVQGEIYSVIDTAVLLGLSDSNSPHKQPLAIAVSMPDGNYALTVSAVKGIIKVTQLQQLENDNYTITYQTADDDVITALSVPSIVESPEFANMSIF